MPTAVFARSMPRSTLNNWSWYVLRHTLALVAIALTSVVTSFSQLTLTQVAFPSGTPLDVSNYPTVLAQVKVLYNGAPVELAPSAFSIIETNTAYNAASVTYTGNGLHTIRWVPMRFGFLQCALVVGHEGLTATTNFTADVGKSKGAQVVVQDSTGRLVPKYVDFGYVALGQADTLKLKVVAQEAALAGDPAQERPILLESVTTTRPEFQVVWKGSYSSGPLPTNIISPLGYRFDIVCKPTSNEPLYDVLTITFEGGMRTTVMVVANPPQYPRRTILELTSPNGGESLAPCQEVPVRWSGMVKGFQAHLEFSTDNGRTWEYVDSTSDSTYVWRVPEDYSDSVRMRVFQKFEASSSIWLNGPRVPVTNIAYSADGRYLAAAYTNGDVVEWDVVTAAKTATYQTGKSAGMQVTALTYVGTSRSIIAGLTRAPAKGGTLLRFDPGTANPTVTGVMATDLAVADVGCNSNGSTLYLLPKFCSRIPTYDAGTLQIKSNIQLSGTAASTTLNGPILAASLLSGEVVLYSTISGNEIDRAQTGLADVLGPYTNQMAASITGRLVALAGPTLSGVANGPKEQRTFIYDMQTNQMVKILYREGSDVVNLGFSASDGFLGLGFMFNPQFVVYDLESARTLPPTGSAAGHMGKLTDIAFAPDAATVVTSSQDSTNNLLLRRVSVPESDMSDAPFTIAPVRLSITPVVMRRLLLATKLDTTITANVCNIGKVLAVFTQAKSLKGTWLSVATPISKDSVVSGECLSLHLVASALDTGLLQDTIELYSCGVRFLLPVSMYVTDRNVQMLSMSEDFGELCIGTSITKRITLLRNADSIPLLISNVYVEGGLGASYRMVTNVVDTTIAPGQTLDVTVEFRPQTLGQDSGQLIIRYENQDVLQRRLLLMGAGIGADLAVSHSVLPFIPEIPVRSIVLTNNSATPVTITEATITSGAPFTVQTPLPVIIPSHDSVEIMIEYVGGTVTTAEVALEATPCAAETKVQLMLYSGSATVSAPIVSADPRSDTTSLPIYADVTETVPYKGNRTFTGVLRVNPRLYLAHSISSPVGSALIVSQNVVDGWREIQFEVHGWFEGRTEIARLVGYAGMAEVDTSLLEFDTTSIAFGSAVHTRYNTGLLRIVHPDPTRRIVDIAPITITGVAPMPSSDVATLLLDAKKDAEIRVAIIDVQGTVLRQANEQVTAGNNNVQLDVSKLQPGSYVVEVVVGSSMVRTQLVVLR